jgi:hypothetical protein
MNMWIFYFLIASLLTVSCRAHKSQINDDNLTHFKGNTSQNENFNRVCESSDPERRYFLDEPNDRNISNWTENFNASVNESATAKKLLSEQKHRFALYLWGESAYSFIRLIQAFDLIQIEKAYPTFKGQTATWYNNLTSDFEDALKILFEKDKAAPETPRTVYRGAKVMDPDLLDCWQKHNGLQGHYIELGAGGRRGSASSSGRVSVAQKFSGAAGTMITIVANSMVDISTFKKNPSETEFVLLPGARFMITSFEKKGNQTLVALKELPGTRQTP